jgi:hypothetical protein
VFARFPAAKAFAVRNLVGAKDEGYNSIPSLAVVFNLCDRRFDTRSGRMTWHLMKK